MDENKDCFGLCGLWRPHKSYLKSGSCDLRQTFKVRAWVLVKFITDFNTDLGIRPETNSSIHLKHRVLMDWAKNSSILQQITRSRVEETAL